LVVVLLVLSALVGILSAAGVYSFLLEYGTTSGSWADGAVGGLAFGAVPLLIVAVLAGVAFFLGRHTPWARGLAVGLVVLGASGALAAGGQAAVGKYDRLAKVPYCGTAADVSLTGARVAQPAFADLEHPEPFGGGWYGVEGCGATLLNMSFVEAAAYYREHLPTAGWRITRDDSSGLAARRNDLIFVVTERCGSVEVEIITAAGGENPNRC
jgi:hypothetical protein